MAGFPHEAQHVVFEGEQCPAEKVMGFSGVMGKGREG